MSADLTLTASVAFGNVPNDPTPTMVPLTGVEQVKWKRGRSYEQDQIQPGTGSVTLDNTSGDLTPGNPTSSHYPNVTSEKLATITVTPPAPYDATAYPAHTGETTAWPTTFPGQGFGYAQTVMTTVDVMDALSLVDLESTYVYAVKADSPAGYWVLDDPEGSTVAHSRLSGGDPLGFGYSGTVGGFASFAQPTFVTANPSDPSTSLDLAPASSGGATLRLPFTVAAPTTPWSFETLFAGITANSTTTAPLLALEAPTAVANDLLVYATISGGSPSIGVYSADLGISGSVASPALSDGSNSREHHIVITWDGTTLKVYVDGVLTGSFAKTNSPTSWSVTGPANVTVGASRVFPQNVLGGRLAHMAWWTSALTATQISNHVLAATGFPFEGTGSRIARILNMAGDTGTRNLDTGASTTTLLMSGGSDAASLIAATCDTEQGQFFISANGARTFHDRHHRLNRGPVLYLSGDCQANLSPDPSFERGLGSGSPWGGWTIALRTNLGLAATPTPADGTAVMQMSRTVSTGSVTCFSPLIPVPYAPAGTGVGQVLTAQCLGQSSTATSRTLSVTITCYNAVGTSLSSVTGTGVPAPTGSWTLASATITCPAGTVSVGYAMSAANLANGETFALDCNRVAVEPTPAAWSAAQGGIEGDLSIELDREHIVNDLTYTLPTGATIPRTDTQSITAHRRRKKAVNVSYTSEPEARDAADWYLHRYSQPQVRVNTITVDLLTQPWLYPLLLALEVGDRVQMVGLPANALPTIDTWAESVEFDLGVTSQRATLTLGNADTSPYFTLDDPIFGRLDSGNLLAF